nr:unnamed protein product [Callosobruchus analis]
MVMRLLLFLAVAAIAASQHCRYTPPSIPIDVEKLSGVWYSQHRFGAPFITPGCFKIDISAKEDGGFSVIFDYKNR